MTNNHKKKTLLTKTISALTNDELFSILYSNEYSMVTLKQVSKILRERGVYMDKVEFENKVKLIFVEHTSLLTLSSDLSYDFNVYNHLDSLDTIEVIMALEEEFDIEISDETAEKCNTFKDVLISLSKLCGFDFGYEKEEFKNAGISKLNKLIDDVESSLQSTQTAYSTKDTPMGYDKFGTLLRASQHLSQGITVTPEGKFSMYSEYHKRELTFDNIDKLEEYVNLIKKLNSVKG